MCGFIAQLVEHRTGIAEVTGSNPVDALIFFRLLLSNCLNWKIYCDDHSSLRDFFVLTIVNLDPIPISHTYKRAAMSLASHIALRIIKNSAQDELSNTVPVSWSYRGLGRDS